MPDEAKTISKPSAVSSPSACYAIVCCDDKVTIAYGVSVVAAWNAAEDVTGEKTKTLRKHGYKLVEGRWQNGKVSNSRE